MRVSLAIIVFSLAMEAESFYNLTTATQKYLVTSVTAELVKATAPKGEADRFDPLLPSDGDTLREVMVRSHYGTPDYLRTPEEWKTWLTEAYVSGIEGAFGSKALHEASLHAQLPALMQRRVKARLLASVNEAERRVRDESRPLDLPLAAWILAEEMPRLFAKMNAEVPLAVFKKDLSKRTAEEIRTSERIMTDIHTASLALYQLLDSSQFGNGLDALRTSVNNLDAMVVGALTSPDATLTAALDMDAWMELIFRDHTEIMLNKKVDDIVDISIPLLLDPFLTAMQTELNRGQTTVQNFNLMNVNQKDLRDKVSRLLRDARVEDAFVIDTTDIVFNEARKRINRVWTVNNGDIATINPEFSDAFTEGMRVYAHGLASITNRITRHPLIPTFDNSIRQLQQVGRTSLRFNIGQVKSAIVNTELFTDATPQWTDLLLHMEVGIRTEMERILQPYLNIQTQNVHVQVAITDFLNTLRNLQPEANGVWGRNASRHWLRVFEHMRYLVMGRWSSFPLEEKTIRDSIVPGFWKRQVPTPEETVFTSPKIRALTAAIEKGVQEENVLSPEVDRLYDDMIQGLFTMEMLFTRIKAYAPTSTATQGVGMGYGTKKPVVTYVLKLRTQIDLVWATIYASANTLRSTYNDPYAYNMIFAAENPTSNLRQLVTNATRGSTLPTTGKGRGARQSVRAFVVTFITEDLYKSIITATEDLADHRLKGVYERDTNSYRYHTTTTPPSSTTFVERQDLSTGHFYRQSTTQTVLNASYRITDARRLLEESVAKKMEEGIRMLTQSEAAFFGLTRQFATLLRASDGKNTFVFYGGQAEDNGTCDGGDGNFPIWWHTRDATKPLRWLHRISFWVGTDAAEVHSNLETTISAFNQVDRAREGLLFVEGRFEDLSQANDSKTIPAEVERTLRTTHRARLDFYCINITPLQSEVLTRWSQFLEGTQKLSYSVHRVLTQFALGVAESTDRPALDSLDVIMQDAFRSTDGTNLFETNGLALNPRATAVAYSPFSLQVALTAHSQVLATA